jgi:hypothetical protein
MQIVIDDMPGARNTSTAWSDRDETTHMVNTATASTKVGGARSRG